MPVLLSNADQGEERKGLELHSHLPLEAHASLASVLSQENHSISQSALGAARLRALHQSLDHPALIHDPLAEALFPIDRAVAADSPLDHPSVRQMRNLIAIRSRLCEDKMNAAVANGTRQILVLGAGLDTCAYRLALGYPDLRIFELDRRATQTCKQELLASCGIPAPSNVRFIPFDLAGDTASTLRNSGFAFSEPVFISWLGVTPYLERSVFLSTLQIFGLFAIGSAVVFDYAISPRLLDAEMRAGLAIVARHASESGEPFRLTLEPLEVDRHMRAVGFCDLIDLDEHALNDLYCRDRQDNLNLHKLAAHILYATK